MRRAVYGRWMEERCGTGTGEMEAELGDDHNPIQLAWWLSGLDTGDWEMSTLVYMTYGMGSWLVSLRWISKGLISTRFNVKVESDAPTMKGLVEKVDCSSSTKAESSADSQHTKPQKGFGYR